MAVIVIRADDERVESAFAPVSRSVRRAWVQRKNARARTNAVQLVLLQTHGLTKNALFDRAFIGVCRSDQHPSDEDTLRYESGARRY